MIVSSSVAPSRVARSLRVVALLTGAAAATGSRSGSRHCAVYHGDGSLLGVCDAGRRVEPRHGLSQLLAHQTRNPSVRRALIMVHGTNRNADHYFQTAVGAAFLANALQDTVVIAPSFLSADRGCMDKLAAPQGGQLELPRR